MNSLQGAVLPNARSLTALFRLAVVGCLIWQIGVAIANGAIQNALLLGAGLAILAAAGNIFTNWRSGIYLLLVWLLFEDLVRKYMGNSMYVYFGKDLLIALAYISFAGSRSEGDTEPFHPPFRYALALFVLLGMVQVFNPGSPSIFYGLLGLKLYYYYIPLMFVGHALIRTERDLRRFFVINMALAVVITAVGIAQSVIGLEFLNPHSGADIDELAHLTRYTPSGLAVTRPPSVFVSDGRFGSYLTLTLIMGLGAAGYLFLRKVKGKKISVAAVALVVVGGVISGSRGAFVYLVASLLVLSAGMLWGAPATDSETYRLVKAIRRSFVYAALALALGVSLFPDVIAARWTFYQETLSPYSPTSEASFRIWDYPVANFLAVFSDPDWMIGHGTGTASLGGQYVSRILGVPATNFGAENGYGNLIVELGILGPILWLAFSLSIVFSEWRVVRNLKGTWAFPIALAILWFSFLLLFPFTWGGLVAYQNFVFNAYFWLLVGILFRLPALIAQDSVIATERCEPAR